MLPVSIAVEGLSDVGVVRAILRECGAETHLIVGRSGKNRLLGNLAGYNASAQRQPWLVLLDLNGDFTCAPAARARWLPLPSAQMCFRIAVTEVEAWLLADREQMARFLGVSESLIPTDPEALTDPKQETINLARKSRKREIREGLVPRMGSGASIGPTYASDISLFAESTWRPDVAAVNAPSLNRCLERLAALVARLTQTT